jgi:hypothetical protein
MLEDKTVREIRIERGGERDENQKKETAKKINTSSQFSISFSIHSFI